MQNKKYWQRNNPSTKESKHNDQSPQFLNKAYSFQDAMFQSFGHNEFPKKRQCKQKIDKSQEEIKSSQQNIMLPTFYQLKQQRNQQFNLNELAEKIKKIDAILKIPKNILHPCVLAINSMNKAKTETIIEINQGSNDQKSKILCHNANKYLALINIVDQQYQKFKNQEQRIEQVNNRLESRNQLELHELDSYSKSNQTNILSKSRRKSKVEPIPKKIHRVNKTNQTQIQNLSGIGNYSNESSFLNNASNSNSILNSNSISNSNPISNFTYKRNQTNNSNEQTFKRIETPKVFQNYINQNRQYSPARSQSFQKYTPLKNMKKQTKIQRIQKQSTSPINKTRERSKSLNSKSPNSKIIKNSDSQSKFLKIKQKQRKNVKKDDKIRQKGNNTKKIDTNIRTTQIDIYATRPKNLAFKTVDQTNQFEKMLKMASSRMKYE